MSSKQRARSNDKGSAKQRSPKRAPKTPRPAIWQQTDQAIVIQRARVEPSSLTASDMLQLQRNIGNRAVGRLLRGRGQPAIQRQPEEEEELQLKIAQRQSSEEEEELMMKPLQPVGLEGGKAPPKVESAIDRARGGGQLLDSVVQTQMSETLGFDFSQVRVHTDAEAHDLNQQLSARAFTTGQDIFFQQGEYNPGSGSGRELIAHELSHVVQQSSGRVSGSGSGMTVRPAGDAFEQEAETQVRRPAPSGLPGSRLATLTGGSLQRAGHEGSRPTVVQRAKATLEKSGDQSWGSADSVGNKHTVNVTVPVDRVGHAYRIVRKVGAVRRAMFGDTLAYSTNTGFVNWTQFKAGKGPSAGKLDQQPDGPTGNVTVSSGGEWVEPVGGAEKGYRFNVKQGGKTVGGEMRQAELQVEDRVVFGNDQTGELDGHQGMPQSLDATFTYGVGRAESKQVDDSISFDIQATTEQTKLKLPKKVESAKFGKAAEAPEGKSKKTRPRRLT